MNVSRIITLIVAATLSLGMATEAQVNMTVKQIAGTPYYTYQIKNKETLYGIAQKTHVPEDVFLNYNPWANGKLEKDQLLFVPSAALDHPSKPAITTEVAVTTAQPPVTHTIGLGENVCTIAKRYNASVEGILAINPTLKPEDYTPGQVIRVTPSSALPFNYEKTSLIFQSYVVQPGDTYTSLSRTTGLTVADLLAANPKTKKPKKGKMLILPTPRVERLVGNMATIDQADLEAYYMPRLNVLYEKMIAERRNADINIALVLPFQLHKSAPPKQAYLYTDFYKGFLLALDSVKNTSSRKINLKVYDTQHNLNVTDSLLALPEMRNMSVIIAPSEPKQLERINAFGKQNNIDVLNCFSTKNEDYVDNPNVYEVNTPSKHFTNDVLRWFDNEFSGCDVIYLEDPDSEGKDIFDDIRNHIAGKGMTTNTITLNGDLSFDRVSRVMNPGSRCVFIPSSSSKNVLKKVVRALKQAKDERFDCDMALLAYPEYVLYLKDYQEDLQTIDTYMFSRFFNAKGYRTRDFDTLYKRWFGGQTLVSYPNMGLLGYDTAMFLVNALNDSGSLANGNTHKGIQTSFRFERENERGGYVNQAINIVHFTTDHTIITEVK